MPTFSRDRFAVLALAALAVAGVLAIGRQPGVASGFSLDDAWIHMVYGRSLATEGILAYNPGEAASGSTAPLWSLAVGLAHLLLQSISVTAVVIGVMALGVLAHLAAVWLAMDLAARITYRRWPALLAGLLLAVSAPLAVGAISGMEVALCAALILAGVRATWLGRWWRAGLWLALAAAARPEAACVALVCFAAVAGRRAHRDRENLLKGLFKLALPSLVVAALIVGHNLLAGGRPLPATFYFKEALDVSDLPRRLDLAFTALLAQVPPFWGFAAWLGLTGYLQSREATRAWLLPAAGLGFVAGVILMIQPTDPSAFYHLRYYLPAVPMLTVATVVGAYHWSTRLTGRWSWTPVAILLGVGLAGGVATFVPVSRHYHNDVRNIEEVQVAMGRWLGEHTLPDRWIAASDAGAVRYFSRRPVVDVMGPNTPDLYWDQQRFVSEHPVDALALMLSRVRPRYRDKVLVYTVMKTEGFTVTRHETAAEQHILGCRGEGAPIPLEFGGLRNFTILCRPGGIRRR